jgi:hypothetical protein
MALLRNAAASAENKRLPSTARDAARSFCNAAESASAVLMIHWSAKLTARQTPS